MVFATADGRFLKHSAENLANSWIQWLFGQGIRVCSCCVKNLRFKKKTDGISMIFIQLHWFYSIPSLKTFKAVVYEIVNRPLQLSPPCRGTHGSTEGKASALVETVGTILALKARKMSKNPLDRRHWNFTTNAILLFAENHSSFFPLLENFSTIDRWTDTKRQPSRCW